MQKLYSLSLAYMYDSMLATRYGGKDAVSTNTNEALYEYEKVKNDFKEALYKYREGVKSLIKAGVTTEQSLYEHLKELLSKTALLINSKACTHVDIIINPSKDEDVGPPVLSIPSGKMCKIGVVIAKRPRLFMHLKNFISLVEKQKSEQQVQKYLRQWRRILFTSFDRFLLVQEDVSIIDEKYIIENNACIDILSQNPLTEDDIKSLWILLYLFLTQKAKKIDSPELLAKYLAEEAKIMKDIIRSAIDLSGKGYSLSWKEKAALREAYDRMKSKFSHRVYKNFDESLAQVIIYTFILVRVEKYLKKKHVKTGDFSDVISIEEVKEYVKKDHILSELLEPFLDILWSLKEWQSEDVFIASILKTKLLYILDIVNTIDMQTLTTKYTKLGGGQAESEFITHFYETFLAEYDPELRKNKGVFYTPTPVVNFIVDGVHYLLAHKFGKEHGLATDGVKVTDPATGTGSFLIRAIEAAVDEYRRNVGKIDRGKFIKHITNDFIGFELMMVPYIISHLRSKIALSVINTDGGNALEVDVREDIGDGVKGSLQDKNDNNSLNVEKIKIYLYDTLSDAKENKEAKREEQEATDERNRNCTGRINKDLIEVIIGNPPYSEDSTNKSEWILSLLREGSEGFNSYYYIGNQEVPSVSKRILQNDYVKFIRFAQCKVHNSGKGIVAMITPNSFLCDVSFSGMRKSLLETFDEIYIINLNGNVRMKDKKCKIDENIFDIKTGVAIFFFVKTGAKFVKSGEEAMVDAKVYYVSICGTREIKLNELKAKTLQTMLKEKNLKIIHPIKISIGTREYCFKELELTAEEKTKKYERWLNLDMIFREKRTGVVTGRDSYLVGFSFEDLESRMNKFLKMPKNQAIKEKYEMDEQKDSKYKEIDYRPFDKRYVYYAPYVLQSLSLHIMRHMLSGNENIGLVFTRNSEKSPSRFNAFVTDKIVDINFFPNAGAYIAPLFLYNKDEQIDKFDISYMHNFNLEFLKTLLEKYSLKNVDDKKMYDFIKEIFYYIYAILYSNLFTSSYRNVIKFDSPRIPFVSDYDVFKKIASKGEELIATHLLRNVGFLAKEYGSKIYYRGNSLEATPITKVKYIREKKILLLNDNNKMFLRDNSEIFLNDANQIIEMFVGIEPDVWNFYIGSINPLKNYLKNVRSKGQEFNTDDKSRFLDIARALTHTIYLQKEIDLLYKEYKIEENAIDFSHILLGLNNSELARI